MHRSELAVAAEISKRKQMQHAEVKINLEILHKKDSKCSYQIQLFTNAIDALPVNSPKVDKLSKDLSMWWKCKEAVQKATEIFQDCQDTIDKLNYCEIPSLPEINEPAECTWYQNEQPQMCQVLLEKIFWENVTEEEKDILNNLICVLKIVHPDIPENKLKSTVFLVYNRHKKAFFTSEVHKMVELVGEVLQAENQGKRKTNNEEQQENVCIICHSPVKSARSFLPCAHSFHRQCIREWLRKQRICPICRKRC